MRRAVLTLALGAAVGAALGSPSVAFADTLKFACAMPHFNIQYVAGGNIGLVSKPNPNFDYDAEQVEDLIVTQSFQPVLDLFQKHPTWHTNIELQGYMIDVLAARHTDVLTELRTLAKAGQIDLVSFHYSDQLFLAHPPADWQRSADLTRQTFMANDLPLSGTVFCQEGQASRGMPAAMKANGWDTQIFPKNLWHFQLGPAAEDPLYVDDGIFVLTYDGQQFSAGGSDVTLTWWYVDDGELLATGGLDPYLGSAFQYNAASVAMYEQQLETLESQGYKIATVAEYVQAISPLVMPVAPPPLLDGTWQPDSTDGSYKWLGGSGLHGPDERDNEMRSLAALAHRELALAEVIAKGTVPDAEAAIAGAYRLLALGEVSDATGINPIGGEALYGIAHEAEALRIAREIIDQATASLGGQSHTIDALAGTITAAETPATPMDIAAPFAVDVVSGDRAATTTWTMEDDGTTALRIDFSAGKARSLSATIPGMVDDVIYTPALASTPIHVPRTGLVFDHFDLALSDGLLGLGGNQFLVLDQGFVHLGARITPTAGDVTIHDDTAPVGEAVTWVFHFIEGESAAAAYAEQLNVSPRLVR